MGEYCYRARGLHPPGKEPQTSDIRPNGKLSDEDWARKKRVRRSNTIYHGNPKEEKLCWSCGWNVYNELTSSYGSRIHIYHTRGSTGIWEVGSRWLIRDQLNDASSLGNDFVTQEFLRKQPGVAVPLVGDMRILSAPTDKVVLTLMARAQGVGLDSIWHTLSAEQQASYREQLGCAITQWRRFTSLTAQKVDGSVLDDCLIGYCQRRSAPTCKKMGRTTAEWFVNLSKGGY